MKRNKEPNSIILGASLSIRACRQLNIDLFDCMLWTVEELGITRFRLMSYWDEHEKQPGDYDFTGLTRQLDLAQRLGAKVSLCLGLRQPRWPETHKPGWSKTLNQKDLKVAVLEYIRQVLKVVDGYDCIISYQLENEALNKGIGHDHDFSRSRLRSEFSLVKQLSAKPVIMSLSNSWGVPILGPIPDIFAISIYPYQWTSRGRSDSKIKPWMVRLRTRIVGLIWRRQVFCHELQMEPWGEQSIDHMDDKRQLELMNPKIMYENLQFVRDCHLQTADLWGAEWWYYRSQKDKILAADIYEVLRQPGDKQV